MAASSAGLLTGIIIDIVVCIISFLAFSILRLLPFSRRYYAPKLFMEVEQRPYDMPYSGRWAFINWLWPIINYKEPDIITAAGLDTAIYLRVLGFGVELFFYVSLWCLIALLPVNLTATYIDELESGDYSGDYKFSTFDKCSIANIPLGSNLFWVHMISVYAVSLITLWLLYKYSRESVLLRIMFIANSKRGRSSHTVLVTDIPAVAQATKTAMGSIKEQRKSGRKAMKESGLKSLAERGSARGSGKLSAEPLLLDNPNPLSSVASATHPATNPKTSTGTGGAINAAMNPGGQDTHRTLTPAATTITPTTSGAGSSSGGAGGGAGGAPPNPPRPPPPPANAPPPPRASNPGSSGGWVDPDFPRSSPGGNPNPNPNPYPGADPGQGDVNPDADGPYATPAGGNTPKSGSLASQAGYAAPSAGAGRAPFPDTMFGEGLHKRKKFTYDVNDTDLDTKVMAEKALQSGLSPKQLVAEEFNHVYPKHVVAVNVVCDQSALEPYVTEYDKLKEELLDLLDAARYRYGLGKVVKRSKKLIFPKMLGKWGKDKYGGGLFKSVDAIDFYIERLRFLDYMIENEQPLSAQVMWPSAFITFKTRQDQACAATSMHHHDTHTWLTRPAPEPDEMLWFNLGLIVHNRTARNTAMWAAFWAMCFFYLIPVAAVQAVIEGPILSNNPVLAPLVGNVVVGKLLESIVPGLALKIFLAIVPWILECMIRFSGAISLSEVDLGVVTRFFIFQVITVFFGSVLMGSFFNQVTQWIEDPASVISVLGTAIPMVSTFFITYIAVNGLFVKPLAFIRIVGLVIFWLLEKLAGSPRARDRVWQQQKTKLGTTVVDHTIVVLLGLIYSCINPIITPFCLTYHCVNLVIERYSNIYITTRDYESSGLLWPRIFTQVMVALYLFQLCMIGLLGIKKFPYAPILVPLILGTIAFHFVCLHTFGKPWHLMSLHDAAMLDGYDQAAEEEERREIAALGRTSTGFGAEPQDRVYMSPCLKVEPGEIEEILAQAQRLGQRIDEDPDAQAKTKKASKCEKAKTQQQGSTVKWDEGVKEPV